MQFTPITLDPNVMGGNACIRGMRVTVGMVVGLLAAGRSRDEILAAYPILNQRTSIKPWPMPRGALRSGKFRCRLHEHSDSDRHESE